PRHPRARWPQATERPTPRAAAPPASGRGDAACGLLSLRGAFGRREVQSGDLAFCIDRDRRVDRRLLALDAVDDDGEAIALGDLRLAARLHGAGGFELHLHSRELDGADLALEVVVE